MRMDRRGEVCALGQRRSTDVAARESPFGPAGQAGFWKDLGGAVCATRGRVGQDKARKQASKLADKQACRKLLGQRAMHDGVPGAARGTPRTAPGMSVMDRVVLGDRRPLIPRRGDVVDCFIEGEELAPASIDSASAMQHTMLSVGLCLAQIRNMIRERGESSTAKSRERRPPSVPRLGTPAVGRPTRLPTPCTGPSPVMAAEQLLPLGALEAVSFSRGHARHDRRLLASPHQDKGWSF